MGIFIDTDCGVDDALALAIVIRHFGSDVVGITSTSGNTSARQAASNVKTLLQAMGHHIPVLSGPDPTSAFTPRDLHGPDGLGGYGRVPVTSTNDEAAAAAIRAFCDGAGAHDVLLCIGPLTNLARAKPASGPRIVAVGGAGVIGEPDPGRDPNSEADIPATTWVTNNLSVDWVTINAGENVWLDDSNFGVASSTGRFLRAIHESYGWHCASRAGRATWSPSAYDALAAVVAIDPQLTGWVDVSAKIDGTTLWGSRGGVHRMLTADGGNSLTDRVRSTVARTLS